ncbi:MAG TPA: YitT family protein [Clostridia bacterium]|nr:YitT family protein [Clostridia bacterium]
MKRNKNLTLVKRIVYILIGSFIHAYGLNALLVPHSLLSGGVTGIAMFIEHFWKIPISLSVILLNIPLFIVAYKMISKRFIYLSILGIFSMSFFINLTRGWVLPIESPMIGAIFGGIIMGIGAGIIIKNRGSLGGTDVIAVIINKHLSIGIGVVTTLFNVVVLTMAVFMFDIELAMYTMVSLFISSKAIDSLQEGFNHKKTIIIVSDHSEEIAKELLDKVGRGVTFLDGEGAYTRSHKKLIYMVVRIMELARVKDIVRRVDGGAFMSILDTKEVEGKGFGIGDLF